MHAGVDVRNLRIRHFALAVFALCVLAAPRLALADDDAVPHNMHELWRTWGFDWAPTIGLALSAILYVSGVWKTWRASGLGHGIQRRDAIYFGFGWLVLFIALVSPIHPWGEILFSAHMVQHELLMLGAAPLLVMSRPMVAFLRGLPAPVSRILGRFSNTRFWKFLWGGISKPSVAWVIHFIVLWGWHAPILFQATLYNDWIHAAQHICFLASALLFWWALVHGYHGKTNYGLATLYLFTTAVHSGLLGAILTFAQRPWYPAYDQTAVWGLTTLEDQQLGGLIMWIPACTVYIVAVLFLFAKWLKQSEQISRRAVGSHPMALERSAT